MSSESGPTSPPSGCCLALHSITLNTPNLLGLPRFTPKPAAGRMLGSRKDAGQQERAAVLLFLPKSSPAWFKSGISQLELGRVELWAVTGGIFGVPGVQHLPHPVATTLEKYRFYFLRDKSQHAERRGRTFQTMNHNY